MLVMNAALLIISLLFAGLTLSPASARADTFTQLENDPLYKMIQHQCVPGDRAESLLHFQRELIDTTDKGIKVGLLASIGLKNPMVPDPVAAKEWTSTAFYLGLLDCLGNDSEGLTLAKAFAYELVLDYSLSTSVSFGAANFATLRIFTLFSAKGVMEFDFLMTKNVWLAEFLADNPLLFPRLNKFSVWLGDALSMGTVVLLVEKGYKEIKREDASPYKEN
jgi:hypothetical protein